MRIMSRVGLLPASESLIGNGVGLSSRDERDDTRSQRTGHSPAVVKQSSVLTPSALAIDFDVS